MSTFSHSSKEVNWDPRVTLKWAITDDRSLFPFRMCRPRDRRKKTRRRRRVCEHRPSLRRRRIRSASRPKEYVNTTMTHALTQCFHSPIQINSINQQLNYKARSLVRDELSTISYGFLSRADDNNWYWQAFQTGQAECSVCSDMIVQDILNFLYIAVTS